MNHVCSLLQPQSVTVLSVIIDIISTAVFNIHISYYISSLSYRRLLRWATVWPQYDMGRKVGEAAVPLSVGRARSHLIQCRLDRSLPPYQVASCFIRQFGHNILTLQTGPTRQRSRSIGRTVTRNGRQICYVYLPCYSPCVASPARKLIREA